MHAIESHYAWPSRSTHQGSDRKGLKYDWLKEVNYALTSSWRSASYLALLPLVLLVLLRQLYQHYIHHPSQGFSILFLLFSANIINCTLKIMLWQSRRECTEKWFVVGCNQYKLVRYKKLPAEQIVTIIHMVLII